MSIKVLALVRDLLLRSRIEAVGLALGAEAAFATSLESARERCREFTPGLIVVDLSDPAFVPVPTAEALRVLAPGARLIGFASHVDLKPLAAARAAGFESTLSRSELMARLPGLLGG